MPLNLFSICENYKIRGKNLFFFLNFSQVFFAAKSISKILVNFCLRCFCFCPLIKWSNKLTISNKYWSHETKLFLVDVEKNEDLVNLDIFFIGKLAISCFFFWIDCCILQSKSLFGYQMQCLNKCFSFLNNNMQRSNVLTLHMERSSFD